MAKLLQGLLNLGRGKSKTPKVAPAAAVAPKAPRKPEPIIPPASMPFAFAGPEAVAPGRRLTEPSVASEPAVPAEPPVTREPPVSQLNH